MGGAYTAQPDASTAPSVPDNWNPEWPFPGVAPPGYEPFYISTLDVPRTTYPGEEVYGCVCKLSDHGDWTTDSPSGSAVWSATLKSTGDVVNLKSAFEGEYAPTFSEEYYYLSETYYGLFYGSEPAFNFDISTANIGDYIVLKATGTPFGTEYLECEREILIVTDTPTPEEEEEEEEEDAKVRISLTVYMEMAYFVTNVDESWDYNFTLNVGGCSLDVGYAWNLRRWTSPGAPPTREYSFSSGSGASFSYEGSADEYFEHAMWDQLGYARINATVEEPASTFEVGYRSGAPNVDPAGYWSWMIYTYLLVVTKGVDTIAVLAKTVEKKLIDEDDEYTPWCTVNGATGEVTEL